MNILITLFSLAAITVAVILVRKGQRIMGKGKHAIATIVDNRLDRDSDGDVYYPIISFTTDKNQTVTKELDWGISPPRKVGKTMGVAYDPENPNDLITYPRLKHRIIPGILLAAAVAGIVFAITKYV
jgi:hypothetical protein